MLSAAASSTTVAATLSLPKAARGDFKQWMAISLRRLRRGSLAFPLAFSAIMKVSRRRTVARKSSNAEVTLPLTSAWLATVSAKVAWSLTTSTLTASTFL
ncbi:hypothetical protein PLESTB_001650900 [Pleodorina starrii]|uniref:Uncharacterized protein n=1 Tax=Pleodorina starrii TaxID=330485 RepID=A0A9W6BYJ9_9CHLO|nr:hypothetical protein PLESTB_001650900 [Pleodorina starrii]